MSELLHVTQGSCDMKVGHMMRGVTGFACPHNNHVTLTDLILRFLSFPNSTDIGLKMFCNG